MTRNALQLTAYELAVLRAVAASEQGWLTVRAVIDDLYPTRSKPARGFYVANVKRAASRLKRFKLLFPLVTDCPDTALEETLHVTPAGLDYLKACST